MNTTEKLEVLKHIKLGTNEVFYYPYNEGQEPLPLRPISSWELDECLYKALKYAPQKIAELVIKLKLQIVKPEQDIDVSNQGYAELSKFYSSIDYWIVYYAMKDFQDEDFSKPDYDTKQAYPRGYLKVLKMDNIHEMAEAVSDASLQPREVIKEVFADDSGKEIAFYVFYFNTPLTNVKDITKLQRDYLVYSKGNIHKVVKGKQKEAKYVLSGETMTIKQLLEKFK